ncbi:hypothetical protein [Streptomyces virginiae]|uniref:hypothetical protein n=1 Tax=Streptomyces virginiae TaxID=1961 RepID=UPI00225122B8|nr:hypothetical protein [Streptomyces virginiae]MCX5179079.1 hypothetical protein [Streptomyces virginiae]
MMAGPRTHRAVVAVAVGTALLAGCSDGKVSAVPELPASTCFGAFTPTELAPFMGTGEEVRVAAPADARLTAGRKSAICNIYVDGKTRFFASAERLPQGQHFSWAPAVDEQKPEPLPFAENSKLWDSGVAIFLSCNGPTEAFELKLWLDGSTEQIKQEERRPLLAGLMKKYLDFARQQTGCGA